jgi:mitochondrial translocator assembly and maintenance protein 41
MANSITSKASSNTLKWGEDWEENTDAAVKTFSDLPHQYFGVNQHMLINDDLREALRLTVRQFNAPIMYAFAYGSGIFPQSKGGRSVSEAEFRAVHPSPSKALMEVQKEGPKMVDFIFGVNHVQHWHSINMKQHRDHYSCLASLGSGLVSRVQERYGAGVYFHPYITVNGMLIKYGVTSIDNLCTDLSHWDTLYLAGRLQKPVKIIRDHPRVRLANQVNLISAIRTAMLLLPERFSERDLYRTIAAISYLGDPRMALPTENPRKVANIVDNNIVNFRRLYSPLIETLPNLSFESPKQADPETMLDPSRNLAIVQDMDLIKRGNMVRRLPKAFRERLYFQYQKKFMLPKNEFQEMMKASTDEDGTSFKRRQGGEFERRIAQDDPNALQDTVRRVIKQTINWPSTTQSLKSVMTAGLGKSARYLGEKVSKYNQGKSQSSGPKDGKLS